MEHVTIDDVEIEPHPMGVNRQRRNVTDALDAEHVTVVHYELEPGESFSGGLHTHHDQEEVFYVLEGTATFEHREPRDDPGGEPLEVDVEAGEVVHFEPGEFQTGRNESDDAVVALALAAPGSQHNWADIESLAPCGECGELTSHGVREPDDAFVIYCNACGNEMQIA